MKKKYTGPSLKALLNLETLKRELVHIPYLIDWLTYLVYIVYVVAPYDEEVVIGIIELLLIDLVVEV